MLFPLLKGQSSLTENLSSDLIVSIRKYDVIETAIYTKDKQLVFARKELFLSEERIGKIDGLTIPEQKTVSAPKKKSIHELILESHPNSASIMYISNDFLKPTFNISAKNKEFATHNPPKVGYLF